MAVTNGNHRSSNILKAPSKWHAVIMSMLARLKKIINIREKFARSVFSP